MKREKDIEWISEIKKGKQQVDIDFLEIIRNGKPDIRLCKLATDKLYWSGTPSYMFIWIEWCSGPFGTDAGFFFKSFHMYDWKVVHIASWMKKYKNQKDFLEDYPEAKDIFWDHPPIPRGKKEIKISGDFQSKEIIGDAFFDGEFVRITDENDREIKVKPWRIKSIKNAENDDCKSDNMDCEF